MATKLKAWGMFRCSRLVGLDEFENLSGDHSDQANTGSCKERNPQSYIVHSYLGDRVKHA